MITHGHADHARAGHQNVAATPQTLAIMGGALRRGTSVTGSTRTLAYGETIERDGVQVTLVPAGHVLGSAQVVVRWRGMTIVVSGDYKRRRDPTCPAFLPVPCDVFVTEATFGLPVFRHPDDAGEIRSLLHSVAQFPRAQPPGGSLCAGQGAADHPSCCARRDGTRPSMCRSAPWTG